MGDLNISSTTIGDLKNTGTEFSVDAQSTDGAGDQKETTYTNTRWAVQLGYYKKIPELKASIDALARWTIGKGFSSPTEITEMVLGEIKGFGKDTFNTILENQTRVAKIGGDSFAEIIIDPKNEILANLKPLDPSTIQIVANRQGIIIRYNQIGKIKGNKKGIIKTFTPDKIFHLSRDRVADEIHGVSLVDSVEWIILARNEAMADMKQLMHRYVKPRIVFKLDTEVDSKINAFKVKADKASNQGENLYIPMGAVEWELLSVPTNSTLSPLPWIDRLNQYFFQATGVPQIIVGGSSEFSESATKIALIAYEQLIAEEQLYIEEQVLSQLNLEIELDPPVSIQNELISDNQKAETIQATTPEDTSITNVGVNQGVPA